MSGLRITLAALLAGAAMLTSLPASAQPRETAALEDGATPNAPLDEWLRRLVGKYRFEGLAQVIARGDCAPLPPADPEVAEAPPEPFCQAIKGTADCVAIGTGPGVQCIFNVTWKDMEEVVYATSEVDAETVSTDPVGVFQMPGGVSYLDPAMALFGLDPGNSAINHLLVDNKGLPEGGPGFVTGNRGTFRTSCVNSAVLLNAMKPVNFNNRIPDTCDRTVRIDVKPDAKLLFMTVEIEINDDIFTRLTMSMRRTTPAVESPAPAKPAASVKPAAPAKPAASK